MKCVSYNIQYGIGLDGQYDIGRIADAVRGADLIALQEVTRNNPKNGGRDMVTELREALPDYFVVFGPNFEADIGSSMKDGRAVDVHFQFGNMVLSKTPIRMSRNLLLPRRRSFDRLDLQRGALEALVETPLGPVRFYSVHLDHRDPEERSEQLSFLRERMLNYALEGGALSGLVELGLPEPDHPEAYVAMGDFNMLEGSQEYHEICGRPNHEFGTPFSAKRAVDAARHLAKEGKPQTTWVHPDDPRDASLHKRIDYVFVSPVLAPSLKSSHVDQKAAGSDHQPLWVEFG
ncbi:MAG: endonuclease/exonuclease/phosphatase family protein [Rhizobiaceae bacterium]|nr:endonuclease/exonuclease/phosphatase family protein [Rhizobiaceae bacterium]